MNARKKGKKEGRKGGKEEVREEKRKEGKNRVEKLIWIVPFVNVGASVLLRKQFVCLCMCVHTCICTHIYVSM